MWFWKDLSSATCHVYRRKFYQNATVMWGKVYISICHTLSLVAKCLTMVVGWSYNHYAPMLVYMPLASAQQSDFGNWKQDIIYTTCTCCNVTGIYDGCIIPCKYTFRAHLHQSGAGPPAGAGAFSAWVECLHWCGSMPNFNLQRPHFMALGHWSIQPGLDIKH